MPGAQLRGGHADRDNPLQVVPLAMTEADDEGAANRLPVLVRGGGACTVAGCGCGAFTDAAAGLDLFFFTAESAIVHRKRTRGTNTRVRFSALCVLSAVKKKRSKD